MDCYYKGGYEREMMGEHKKDVYFSIAHKSNRMQLKQLTR
jgi:hypothetical protein